MHAVLGMPSFGKQRKLIQGPNTQTIYELPFKIQVYLAMKMFKYIFCFVLIKCKHKVQNGITLYIM